MSTHTDNNTWRDQFGRVWTHNTAPTPMVVFSLESPQECKSLALLTSGSGVNQVALINGLVFPVDVLRKFVKEADKYNFPSEGQVITNGR